jgi:O-antigen/teichoic acid export membrane protein
VGIYSKYKANKSWVDISLTFSRQFVAGMMQLGTVVIVARALGSEGMGSYAVALLVPTLLSQLLSLGLVASNIYFIASGRFDATTVWVASRDISLFLGFLGLCLAIVVLLFFGDELFPGIPAYSMMIAMCIYPIALMKGMITSLFQAWQDFRSFNILIIIQPALGLFGVALLWFLNHSSLANILAVILLSHIFALILGLYQLRRKLCIFALGVPRVAYLKAATKYGIKAHVGGIATSLISRSDVLMVNFFLGPGLAGLYTIAVRIVEQIWLVSQAVSTVIFPKLSAMSASEPDRLRLLSIMSSAVFWSASAIAIIVASMSEFLIDALFGADFLEASPILMILLIGVLFFSSARVLANDFAARNLIHINLYLTLSTMLLNIALNLVLIPRLGVQGAAMATSISYLFNFVLRLTIQQKVVGFTWWRAVIPGPRAF